MKTTERKGVLLSWLVANYVSMFLYLWLPQLLMMMMMMMSHLLFLRIFAWRLKKIFVITINCSQDSLCCLSPVTCNFRFKAAWIIIAKTPEACFLSLCTTFFLHTIGLLVYVPAFFKLQCSVLFRASTNDVLSRLNVTKRDNVFFV